MFWTTKSLRQRFGPEEIWTLASRSHDGRVQIGVSPFDEEFPITNTTGFVQVGPIQPNKKSSTAWTAFANTGFAHVLATEPSLSPSFA